MVASLPRCASITGATSTSTLVWPSCLYSSVAPALTMDERKIVLMGVVGESESEKGPDPGIFHARKGAKLPEKSINIRRLSPNMEGDRGPNHVSVRLHLN